MMQPTKVKIQRLEDDLCKQQQQQQQQARAAAGSSLSPERLRMLDQHVRLQAAAEQSLDAVRESESTAALRAELASVRRQVPTSRLSFSPRVFHLWLLFFRF